MPSENPSTVTDNNGPQSSQEHLKRKEARVMKANKLVGKAAHGKVAALSQVVYLKVRNQWQH